MNVVNEYDAFHEEETVDLNEDENKHRLYEIFQLQIYNINKSVKELEDQKRELDEDVRKVKRGQDRTRHQNLVLPT